MMTKVLLDDFATGRREGFHPSLVSSANFDTNDFSHMSASFMNMIKRIGPSTSGTTLVTEATRNPDVNTRCFLLVS